MNKEEIMSWLEEIMELDEGELDFEAELNDYEEWDSLTRLSLLAEAQDKYNKPIDSETIKSFVTVEDVCKYFME